MNREVMSMSWDQNGESRASWKAKIKLKVDDVLEVNSEHSHAPDQAKFEALMIDYFFGALYPGALSPGHSVRLPACSTYMLSFSSMCLIVNNFFLIVSNNCTASFVSENANECLSSPCGGDTCSDLVNGYRCDGMHTTWLSHKQPPNFQLRVTAVVTSSRLSL